YGRKWLSCRSFFFFSSRRRHTRFSRDWSSDVCSSDLVDAIDDVVRERLLGPAARRFEIRVHREHAVLVEAELHVPVLRVRGEARSEERRVGKGCRSRGWAAQYERKLEETVTVNNKQHI